MQPYLLLAKSHSPIVSHCYCDCHMTNRVKCEIEEYCDLIGHYQDLGNALPLLSIVARPFPRIARGVQSRHKNSIQNTQGSDKPEGGLEPKELLTITD